MPVCANRPNQGNLLLLAFCCLLAACDSRPEGGQFEISQVTATWSNGHMDVRFEQHLSLSPEARNALVHGVPLTVGIELVLRDARTQTRVKKKTVHYEIRYLPLSEHYQLSGPADSSVRTFPRLRHALAELGNLQLNLETGALPRGEYELLARSFLDKQKMPPPMRLPVLFSPRWNHESAWTSWPLDIEPGA
ncbi:MAG: DUF4390 domain-containing protein [Xanthomonadales bacterium]|jgi:hypothetical protein|nr:DUF4390 domain-containing protein [Xanthomonadales bacterium]